jgi:hypothetical protein
LATKELRELRHQYKEAYTVYMHSVQELSEASRRGELPSRQVLLAEDHAIHALNFTRVALLDGLRKHSQGWKDLN